MEKQKKKKFRELPPVGAKLTARFKGKNYEAKIVWDDSYPAKRAIEYNGKKYSSLTGAAMIITKSPINGWRFWKL